MERASDGRYGSSNSEKNNWGADSAGPAGADGDSGFPTEAELLDLKDSKRAWVVCFAACLIQAIIVGVLHAFGLFFIVFIEEFNCSKAKAAWIGSGCYGIAMILGPMASMLMNRWGSRPVLMAGCIICSFSLMVTSFATSIDAIYGTFTVIYGIGCCLAYTPTMCIAGDYFHMYLTLATGIMTSGSSIGTLMLSPLAEALITSIGWRNTFRIFSLFALLCIGCGWMFKPLYKKQKSSVDRIKKSVARRLMTDLQLWKNKVFVIWSLAITCVMFGQYIPYVHLAAHVVDIGFGRQTASMLLTIFGASTACGRIFFGKVVEYGYLNRLHMQQLSIIITGSGCMLLPLIRSVPGLVAYVVFIGLVDSCYVVLLPVLTSTLFVEQRVLAWGFLACVNSITFTLGPPIAGWIYDATGSYNLSFHVAGIPVITGALILFLIPWAQKTATTTNILLAARSYDVMSDTLSDVDVLDSPTGLNRPPSTEDDGSDADNIITIKTPTSYLFVDVAKNEVSQKSRYRRYNHGRPDHGDEKMAHHDKIPDTVWEALDVLRAQSRSIMSLDDVRLNDTTETHPRQLADLDCGYIESRSPTISIAHSRLSGRDGSVQSRSIANFGQEHYSDVSELIDTFECEDHSSMHSSLFHRGSLTSAAASPRTIDQHYEQHYAASHASQHLSPGSTLVGSHHSPMSCAGTPLYQSVNNSPHLTGSPYGAMSPSTMTTLQSSGANTPLSSTFYPVMSPSKMTSLQTSGISPHLQGGYICPVSPPVTQLHTPNLSPRHPFDPLLAHTHLSPIRDESLPFVGEDCVGTGTFMLPTQSRSGTESPTAGSEPAIFRMSDLSLNGDFK